MDGFDMLQVHKRVIIDSNPFAVPCVIFNEDSTKSQGNGAILPETDPMDNPDDKLACIAPYIGVDISTETGMGVFCDRCEIAINADSVKIGEISEGWRINVFFKAINKWHSFKVEHCAYDRSMGTYLIKPTIIKE